MSVGPLFHASRYPEVLDRFLPLSHFGTLAAAGARSSGVVFQGHGKRVYEVVLDVSRPLVIPDMHGTVHSWLKLSDQLYRGRKRIISSEQYASIFHAAAPSGQDTEGGTSALVSILMDKGYDSIRYINVHEDPGSVSWIILDPDTVSILSIDGEPVPDASLLAP